MALRNSSRLGMRPSGAARATRRCTSSSEVASDPSGETLLEREGEGDRDPLDVVDDDLELLDEVICKKESEWSKLQLLCGERVAIEEAKREVENIEFND
ncbi:hypothetical protein ANCCEY_13329 [Ancylostoma ceylanicum]|uniref:Uncharacterized protein n=1 Tax=Ancylostoma ceylanicum TaxID=53326 RepID=A0A0D6L773_9BILA|nr:hypothetical protein ANCCEY_13329 [Ancylostoma ceylanicum]